MDRTKKTTASTAAATVTAPSVNPFKRPMNALQKQWYRVLIARRIGFLTPRRGDENQEPT